MVIYGIVNKRDKMLGLFFVLKIFGRLKRGVREHMEVAKCVQKSHWLVRSASSVTTILPRIRKHILIEWKPRNIADSAGHPHCIKKPNNGVHFTICEADGARQLVQSNLCNAAYAGQHMYCYRKAWSIWEIPQKRKRPLVSSKG